MSFVQVFESRIMSMKLWAYTVAFVVGIALQRSYLNVGFFLFFFRLPAYVLYILSQTVKAVHVAICRLNQQVKSSNIFLIFHRTFQMEGNSSNKI